MFVGFGYDVHRFKRGIPLTLGGVKVPHTRGLLGHSDADVLLHAVMDALLGAAGLADIGHFFPTDDPRFRNISSLLLLREVMRELKKKGFVVQNIASSLIAEEPKVAPHIPAMKKAIAGVMKIPGARIGIKATTNETMGFVGRREGIAAMAVALIEKR
jgi:2-C-methyl-D-erythritol 2,4-cyclodiphosphate synthase